MKGDINKDSTDIKRIINRFDEQLYTNRFNYLNEQSLNKVDNLGELDNLISPVSIKEIEFILKNFPRKKPPSPDSFITDVFQAFKKK